MKTTTDTPRTDAQSWTEYDHAGNMYETKAAVSRHHAEQLERELASVKADNFDLANALSKAETELMQLRKGYCYACEPTGELNQKLEANLRRAIEIAEDSNDSLMDWDENRRCETQKKNRHELEQLKATLNKDKK